MTEQPGLFPEPDPPTTPDPAPERQSADRRRTLRQIMAITTGHHPLGLVFRDVTRHPDTRGQAYDRDQPKGRPLTCGTCRWRAGAAGHRSWPKCLFRTDNTLPPPRATSGAATDVRAWWPACTDYDAGDPGLSPDAWRAAPQQPAGDDGAPTDLGRN